MFTELVGDIYDANQSEVRGLAVFDGVAYTVTTQPAFRSYNLGTIAPLVSGSGVVSGPSGIALVNTSSAIVVSATNSQVDWINLATGARAGVTSGAAATFYSQISNQVVCNRTTGWGLATKSATGSVTLINALSFTCSSMPIAPLTGQNATCVANKDSNFLVGTTDMKIHEVSVAGSLVKSLTLNQAPSGIAVSSLRVDAITYYNNYMLCADTAGILYLYDWSTGTPTLLDTWVGQAWDLNTGLSLTAAVSGTTIMTNSRGTGGTNSMAVFEIYFEKGEIVVQDIFYTNRSTGYRGADIDPIQNYVVVQTTETTSSVPLRLFRTTSNNRVNVPSRIQDPATLDIAGRIIRLRDGGVGKCCVEVDTSIPSSTTNLVATGGMDYIEIALATSPDRWGVREYTA